MNELPQLQKLVAPALATIALRTRIGEQGIRIEKDFEGTRINREKLEAYRSYFSFSDALPMSYLYLIAQRAQGVLMLHKDYTIPIPGTIHLSNYLEQLEAIDIEAPLDIKATLSVPYESEGSLKPSISIVFYQHGIPVALCDSGYLVKRKKRSKSGLKPKRVPDLYDSGQGEVKEWKLDKDVGKAYADISDDHNPIHKSVWAAKLVGFKRPIAHGWFTVSTAISDIGRNPRSIAVSFKRPLLVPATYLCYLDTLLLKGSRITVCQEDKTILTTIDVSY